MAASLPGKSQAASQWIATLQFRWLALIGERFSPLTNRHEFVTAIAGAHAPVRSLVPGTAAARSSYRPAAKAPRRTAELLSLQSRAVRVAVAAVGCRRESWISLGPLAAVKTACECAEPERVPCQKPRLSEEQPDLVRRKVKGLSLVLRGTEAPPSLSGSLKGAQTDKRLGVPLGYSNGHSSPTSHTPRLGWESPPSSTPYWP